MVSEGLRIMLCYSPAPRVLHELPLLLPQGSCVKDALLAAFQDERFKLAIEPWVSASNSLESSLPMALGVWGKKASPEQALRDQDRVELYRPLRVDPKVARRERFKKQGAKSAGLFAKRRPGAKPGY